MVLVADRFWSSIALGRRRARTAVLPAEVIGGDRMGYQVARRST